MNVALSRSEVPGCGRPASRPSVGLVARRVAQCRGRWCRTAGHVPPTRSRHPAPATALPCVAAQRPTRPSGAPTSSSGLAHSQRRTPESRYHSQQRALMIGARDRCRTCNDSPVPRVLHASLGARSTIDLAAPRSPAIGARTNVACGGTGGIRTPGPVKVVRFQGGCIRPLCHRSARHATGRPPWAPDAFAAGHRTRSRPIAWRAEPTSVVSMEWCQSGRMGCPAKALTLRGPWVQIPPTPPRPSRHSAGGRFAPEPAFCSS